MDVLFWLALALMAAAVTVALRTGSLAPYLPHVNRREDPRTFWSLTAAAAATVAVYMIILLWVGAERLLELLA